MLVIIAPLTTEGFVYLQDRLMFEDPNHRWLTGEHVGHSPTNEELVRRWFETGAYARTAKIFSGQNNEPQVVSA